MHRLIKQPPKITVESAAIVAWLDNDARRRAAETILGGGADLDDHYHPLVVAQVNGTGPHKAFNIIRHDNDTLLVIAAPTDPDNPVNGSRFYFAVELDGELGTWHRIGHAVLGESEEDPRQVYRMIMSR